MRKDKTNRLLVGDTLYDLTEAYRNGARACRTETPFWANPHRDGSQRHADWAAGHDNEAAGLHQVSVTVDAIELPPAGLELTAPDEEDILEPAPLSYQVFTRKHDEVIRGGDLLASDPGARLGLREVRAHVAPDQDGLWFEAERAAARHAIASLESGLADQASGRPVMFLLDNSGSMRGRPIAALVWVMGEIGDALDRSGVPFEVLGFTTRNWKGGRSREDWIMEGRPAEPGRLNDLRHIIYRAAAEPWDPEPLNLMLAEGFLKENVDGEALLWAAERGRKLGGAVIVHVTDGKPMDDSTLAANPADYLDRHLETITRAIHADPDLGLVRADLKAESGYLRSRAQDKDPGLGWIANILVEATLQALKPDTPASERSGP